MRAGLHPGEAGEQQGAGGDRRHGPGGKAQKLSAPCPAQFHAAGDLADSRLDPIASFGDDLQQHRRHVGSKTGHRPLTC